MVLVTAKSMLNTDEFRWVIHIRKALEEVLEDEKDIPVCIFNVPKALVASKPEVYTPQQVAIGPYHYWRPELYEMERYKLAAAKRTQNRLQGMKFQNIVEELQKLEWRIRGCYHRFLDINGETLAWLTAVDLSFLLEYLQIYAIKEGTNLARVSSKMSHLVDDSGRKSAHNAILRDIVMLENQIPLCGLRKFLELEYSSSELADEVLSSMLFGLCRELLPFKMVGSPSIELSEVAHLLDFLYQVIAPKYESVSDFIVEEDCRNKALESEGSFSKNERVKQVFHEIWNLLSKVNKGPIRHIKRVLLSKHVKLVAKLPWTIISKIPGLSTMIQPLRQLFVHEDEGPNSDDATKRNKPPLVEEIMIPSVTELYESGVRFLPCQENSSVVTFDSTTFTLQLPIISLDVNTEVVLRNLVAYEASTAAGPLVFTRYTELMNGIIDTEDDVKLLRKQGIVLNYLKSDGEVAAMWNGMSKSVRLTRVPALDKVIEDVNKYYSGRWKIKVRNFVRTYVFGSWKFLTFLATIFLLLLTTLQAFCSVYSCARVFRISASVAAAPP